MRRLLAAIALAACGADARESTDNRLALTWQPAFCETSRAAECRLLNGGRLPAAAQALSIHGLWPQPRGREYCGVSDGVRAADKAGRWADLPAPEVDAATRAALAAAMPGAMSALDRHEWIKHGTCYGAAGGADEYFDDTLLAAAAVNAAVADLFAANIGRRLTAARIRAAFDAAFGPGAGDRVELVCRRAGGRLLIRELRIGLAGAITPQADIGDLIRAAAPVAQGCSGGVVDGPGRR